MNKMRKLVVGETTETIIRILFDHRILQESSENALNTVSRAAKIKNLKTQILGFIKRNPNSVFELVAPEYKTDKTVVMNFTNFEEYVATDELGWSRYKIVINDNFIDAEIIQKVTIGKDIVLKIKAE